MRERRLGCAERREGGGGEPWTRDDLKWSWMGCRCSMACRSPTTQWSPRSGVMEDLDLSAPEWTELHSPAQGDGKKPPTPSPREPRQRTRPAGGVLGCEVGGRCSDESWNPRAPAAWLRRWSSILACCASRSLAVSLLEQRGGLGADGPTPSSCEVVGDDR